MVEKPKRRPRKVSDAPDKKETWRSEEGLQSSLAVCPSGHLWYCGPTSIFPLNLHFKRDLHKVDYYSLWDGAYCQHPVWVLQHQNHVSESLSFGFHAKTHNLPNLAFPPGKNL